MFQKMLIQTQTYAIVTSVPSKNVFQIFAITILSKTTMLIYLIIHILIRKFFDFIELQVMVTAQTTGKSLKMHILVHDSWMPGPNRTFGGRNGPDQLRIGGMGICVLY